jgi:hypothetical protein
MTVRSGASSAGRGRASQPSPGEDRAGSGRRLQLLDVKRMVETEPRPVEWRIDGLAVDGALTMLAGREGRGKSLLSLALGSAVSRGDEVAGFACRLGRVLVVDVENGEHEAHRRIRSLRPDPDGLSYCVPNMLNLSTELDVLAAAIEQVEPNLVILDSFRPLVPGVDENDSAIDGVLARLRNLAREHRAAFVLLHHTPKHGGEYRGSSAIGAAVELGFTLISQEGADPRLRLECWKSRPAAKPPTRWLEIRTGPDGSPEIVEADSSSPAAASRRDRVSEIVVALASGKKTRAELAERLNEPKSPSGAFVRALREATEGGLVARIEHGVYALAQHLPAPAEGQEGLT